VNVYSFCTCLIKSAVASNGEKASFFGYIENRNI
jgi:hypothetical protein